MGFPEIQLDGQRLELGIPENWSLAACVSVIDRALIGEDQRVVAVSSQGRDAFNPNDFSRALGDFDALSLSSGAIPAAPRKAVVTLAIGDKYRAMFDVTRPTLSAYAKAIGADFAIIDEPRVKGTSVMFEKWQMYELLFRYDRLIFFDLDILISPDCPDLTALVPRDRVGGFIEDDVQDRSSFILGAQKVMGDIGWREGYFNAGMGVYSWLHRPLFEQVGCHNFGDGDQCLYNFRVRYYGFPVFKLPALFNRMDLLGTEGRHAAYAVHYAGKGYTGLWNQEACLAAKVELIRQDAERLAGEAVNADRAPEARVPTFLPFLPKITAKGDEGLFPIDADYRGQGSFKPSDYAKRRPLRDYTLTPLMIGGDCPIGDEIMMLPIAREAKMPLFLPRTFAGDLVADLTEDIALVRELRPDTLVCPIVSILFGFDDCLLGARHWGEKTARSRYGDLNITGSAAAALGLTLRDPAPRLRRPATAIPKRVIVFPKGNSERRSFCREFSAGIEERLKRAGYDVLSGDRRFDNPMDFARFVASAEYVIAPFTGPTHLAAAMGVKTVAVCVGDSPDAYRPLQPNVRVLASDCRECWRRDRRGGTRPCGELFSRCQRVHSPDDILRAMGNL